MDVPYPNLTEWEGTMFVLLTARQKDSHAQWFYENIFPAHSLANLLWYDASLKAIPPDDPKQPLSLTRFFKGLGVVFMRSDWSDNATWISFTANNHYGAHSHNDEGSFTIFKGKPLVLESSVYGANKPSITMR